MQVFTHFYAFWNTAAIILQSMLIYMLGSVALLSTQISARVRDLPVSCSSERYQCILVIVSEP